MKSKKITRKKLNTFLEKQSSTVKTLDIGCGSNYYKDFFPNSITLDVDKHRNPDVVASVYQLPYSDSEFEQILCTEVLEHLSDPGKAINEIKRVLKPGGKLILTTRFIFPLHDVPGDFFRFTYYGLQELFADWNIEKLEPETSSLETVAVLLQRLIFQAKFKGGKVIKLILLILTKLFLFLNRFTKKEFGDIKQTKLQKNILSSGYYLVARKKQPHV